MDFVAWQNAAFTVCYGPIVVLLAVTLALGITIMILRFVVSPIRSEGFQERKKP